MCWTKTVATLPPEVVHFKDELARVPEHISRFPRWAICPYEPLTSENATLVLVDHQVGLMSGVRDYSIAELKHNVVGLAKAARTLKLPIVVTTTACDSVWGPTFPELVEALPSIQIIDIV